ncbi:hypothetical protein TNCV_4705241 [Trichonephila clavipes]|nr:hypothetical protein TNCV_4705241 [Trichonephila clavipes]
MERFINTELAEMHLIYGLAVGSSKAAEILYRERSPQRDAPYHQIFANLHPNLCEYGSLSDNRHINGTFCSMHGTKCVGYRSQESEYNVRSSSHSEPVLSMSITFNDPYSYKL